MRLATLCDDGHESLAVILGDRSMPTAEIADGMPATLAALLAAGDSGLSSLRSAVAENRLRFATRGRPVGEVEFLPPITHPGKIVGTGLNYRDHAHEVGLPTPAQPTLFAKFPTALIGHRAEIQWDPSVSKEVDYEAELAVVIGRQARNVKQSEALSYVFGYTCANDVTARDLQANDGQWVRAKSLDTFCPMGPVIVTIDEIPDPQTLPIVCTVNGEVMQSANTSGMFFEVQRLISYCSAAFVLEPGDVIITGTPAGVGASRKPPRLLTDGDEVVVEIGGIGRLVNTCKTMSRAVDRS
jgi:2-keto-4-pentenoate hydratase/2-oxohepta-3-ene-1,7-dioic acid hydratase in catechol pathway